MPDALTVPRHPAKFSKPILDAIRQELVGWVEEHGPVRALDPFAGVGLVHELRDAGGVETVGVEIQPEWARAHPDTIVGDALHLGDVRDQLGDVNAVVTSAVYPTRMTDSHDAQERCSACGGSGTDTRRANECSTGCDGSHMDGAGAVRCPRGPEQCQPCEGTGRRDHVRNTYTHCLREAGAEPVPGSSVTMKWAKPYRDFHEAAVDEWFRVLPPESLVIVNMSNHQQTLKVDGEPLVVEHRVVEWWVNLLLYKGCRLDHVRRVRTRRNGHGANRDLRVDGEVLIVVQSPSPRWR